jgi:hypothetical protein
MTTVLVEYDEKKKSSRQVIEGLIGAGVLVLKDLNEFSEKLMLKNALKETVLIAKDIKEHGIGDYKTLDDLLDED